MNCSDPDHGTALWASGPCAIESVGGVTDGVRFLTYLADVLAPALGPGDMVMMDNLAAQKVVSIRHAIKAAGARLLYLPPYSPDSDPIEQALPSSKPCCAPLRPAPFRTCGPPSGTHSPASHWTSAGATSLLPAMMFATQLKR